MTNEIEKLESRIRTLEMMVAVALPPPMEKIGPAGFVEWMNSQAEIMQKLEKEKTND